MSEDYELVRVHHPDAPHGRDLSPAVRRSRFQAITAAYDVLRGKKSAASMYGPGDIYRQEIERRRRARAAHEASRMRSEFAYGHPSSPQWTASADDRWKDRIILFVGLMVRPSNFHALLLRRLDGVGRLWEQGSDLRWYGRHIRLRTRPI